MITGEFYSRIDWLSPTSLYDMIKIQKVGLKWSLSNEPTHIYIHTYYTYIHTYIYTHIYIHTYIYTHIHTYEDIYISSND